MKNALPNLPMFTKREFEKSWERERRGSNLSSIVTGHRWPDSTFFWLFQVSSVCKNRLIFEKPVLPSCRIVGQMAWSLINRWSCQWSSWVYISLLRMIGKIYSWGRISIPVKDKWRRRIEGITRYTWSCNGFSSRPREGKNIFQIKTNDGGC